MTAVLVAVAVVPLVAVACSMLMATRVSGLVSVACAAATFALVLVLATGLGGSGETLNAGLLRADALSGVFTLATSFLYLTTSVYAVGHLQAERGRITTRYTRLFQVGLNLFAWSLLVAPIVDGLALLWVAIEVTTVVSALLVAIDDTDEATEAAWKYIVLASIGLGIALLATVFMYAAGASRLGTSYDLALGPLLSHASHLPRSVVLLAFCLAVVGFGTKVGLVPMHTWLPDAHSEAPAPVSALLSGSLLVVSFYAVLRYFQIATRALGERLPEQIMLGFGVATLLLAGLYLLEQHNIKRMLAYSSIEHMGILAIGVSIGVPIALAGVLLHVLAHAAAKSGAFMGAGVVTHSFRTNRIAEITDARARLPWSAPLLLLSALVLSALPPFGIFRSEFQIVRGGLEGGHHVGVAMLVVFATVAFFGLAAATTRMVVGPGSPDSDGPPAATSAAVAGEPSVLMVAAVVAGLVALLLLGVHPPGVVTGILQQGAAELVGQAS